MSEAQDTTERPRRGRPPNPDGALLKQNVRVSKQQWDKMADATRGEGSNTSEVTRELYAWYLGEPGAKLPRRPLARQQSMDLARVAAAAVASRDTGTTESPS